MFRSFMSRSPQAETGDPLKPIAGAQNAPRDEPQPQQETFQIYVKSIEGACSQLESVENVITIPVELPDAVAVEDCLIRNVTVEATITGADTVAVRVRYDVIITYRDATGTVHVLQESFAFPPDTEPPKLVQLIGADPVIHQPVVEVSISCYFTLIEQNGRAIRACVQIDMIIKFGRHIQIEVLGTEVPRPAECTPVAAECPPPGALRLASRKRWTT
ncbi:MAG: hypothetical protein K6T75_11885 [Acetobacteraceae bacterium]|nr:hypothetical protein [Acetobacteraceae bacterium]